MEYGGDPGFRDVDGQWIVDGPNSGGVRFYVLWRGHLFLVEQEGKGACHTGAYTCWFRTFGSDEQTTDRPGPV